MKRKKGTERQKDRMSSEQRWRRRREVLRVPVGEAKGSGLRAHNGNNGRINCRIMEKGYGIGQ